MLSLHFNEVNGYVTLKVLHGRHCGNKVFVFSTWVKRYNTNENFLIQ